MKVAEHDSEKDEGVKDIEKKLKTGGVEISELRRAKTKRTHWVWPLGIAFAGIGAAATVLLRGCWHRDMSWPIRAEDEHGHYAYQVCMNCGVKRLFDERAFRGFGPYDYDLHELIARERLERRRRMEVAALTEPVPPTGVTQPDVVLGKARDEETFPRAGGE